MEANHSAAGEEPATNGARAGQIVSFPIVGIGASAGGLESFTQLLGALPADAGMAYVLVQHLDPTHPSMLATILSRSTSMPVTEVNDEPLVEQNHIYVIPPGRKMTIVGGHLKLSPPDEARGRHRPIDSFLRSLAEDQGHRAIAVILSGTGNDGTLGAEAIKADGGITFAQDESASQSGMPDSAVAAGCVDFVLPPHKIAEELARIGKHPYVVPTRVADDTLAESSINKILRILYNTTGVDFSHYKSTTLYRRITRRMLLHKLDSLEQYQHMLHQNRGEAQALYHDILISVTSFFRDPDAFSALRTTVFPRLLKERSRNDMLRIWVLGCSTGEEAYSIAITLSEVCAEQSLQIPVQVFATDLNEEGIEKARLGVYAKSIAQDLTPERLRRFFVETDRGYQVTKSIRDMCVFARQNVVGDPPFSRMDLISCRNLLIYMEPSLQRRILPLFHYALRPNGFLWLGTSETIGAFADRFEVTDARHKIFAKKPGPPPSDLGLPLFAPAWERGADRPTRPRAQETVGLDAQREADRLAVARYAPPGVLVNASGDILQFRGDTSYYLAPAPGKPSINVLKMAREGLLVGLRTALQQAATEGVNVRQEGLRVKSNGGFRDINVEIVPLREGMADERCFLVLFEDSAQPKQSNPSAAEIPIAPVAEPLTADLQRQVAHLTQELASTRDYLQSLIEQQDAANEELQSANEEIQSSNEELQSINEELQTTKEEIQSSNEELTTVNEELRDRNEQLNQSNSDLTNFLGSTQLALVMLGPDMRIRRFTPQAQRLLNLIASDVGRPIDDIKLPLRDPEVYDALQEVIDNAVVREFDVQDKQGRWYSLRIRPYRTLENKIDGAVLVLVEIDAQKRVESQLRTSDERYRLLMESAEGLAIILLDEQGKVTGWNTGAQRIFGYVASEIEGLHVSRFFPPEDLSNGRPEKELEAARVQRAFDDDNWLMRKDGSRFWASGMTTVLRNDEGELRGYAKVIRDLTQKRRFEKALSESDERFSALFDRGTVGIEQVAPDGRLMLLNSYLCDLLGYRSDELIGTEATRLIHPDDRASDTDKAKQLLAGQIDAYILTKRYLTKDGRELPALCSSTVVRDDSGNVKYRLSVIQDLSARNSLV